MNSWLVSWYFLKTVERPCWRLKVKGKIVATNKFFRQVSGERIKYLSYVGKRAFRYKLAMSKLRLEINMISNPFRVEFLDIPGCHDWIKWKIGINSLKYHIKCFWCEFHASNFSTMTEALFNMALNPISRSVDVNLKHPSTTFTDQCLSLFHFFFLNSLQHLSKSQDQLPVFLKCQLLEYNTFLAIIQIWSVVCIKY